MERLWKGSQQFIAGKVKLFYTTCVRIFLYGCESRILSQDMESKINAFAASCYSLYDRLYFSSYSSHTKDNDDAVSE